MTKNKLAQAALDAFPADINNKKTMKNVAKTLTAVFLVACLGAYTAFDNSAEQGMTQPQQTSQASMVNHKTAVGSIAAAGMATIMLELLLANFATPKSMTRSFVEKKAKSPGIH